MTVLPSDPALALNTLAEWLTERGGALYGGEAVTQLEHALQCATLARDEGATPELVTAALLHDIGHLLDAADDAMDPHEKLAAQVLDGLFASAVTEPIRLHVDAKRHLCAVDPLYWSSLSEMSRRSLVWQGGAFTETEAVAFIAQAHAEDALRLRKWDDAAKIVGARTPPLDEFVTVMRKLAQTAGRPHLAQG